MEENKKPIRDEKGRIRESFGRPKGALNKRTLEENETKERLKKGISFICEKNIEYFKDKIESGLIEDEIRVKLLEKLMPYFLPKERAIDANSELIKKAFVEITGRMSPQDMNALIGNILNQV